MDIQNALTTIDQGFDFSAIDRANLQPSTKKQYRREIEKLLLAGVEPMNYKALQEYAAGLKSSRKQFLRSALRLMSIDYEMTLKAGATDRNVGKIQAGIMRLEAMRKAVEVKPHKGEKAHTWLSQKQVAAITALCGSDLRAAGIGSCWACSWVQVSDVKNWRA